MNLRSPKVESVATYLELKNDPESGANDIQVLEPTLAAADQMAAKLRALPQVARVMTLSSFIPDDQQQKLAADPERGTDARMRRSIRPPRARRRPTRRMSA